MAKETANVRIGPISLLTLISVLLLSVLAVLCITSANAAQVMSQRQAGALEETYKLDTAGQNMLAAIDEQLQGMQGSSGSFAASTIGARAGDIQQQALAAGSAGSLSVDMQTDGARVSFTISAEDGKSLSAAIRVNNDLTYSVEQWETTTSQSEPETVLWTGASSNR